MGIYRDNLSAIIISDDVLSIIIIAYAIILLSPVNYYLDKQKQKILTLYTPPTLTFCLA